MQWTVFILGTLCVQLSMQASLIIDKMEVDADPKFLTVKNELRSADGGNVVDLEMNVLTDSEDISYFAHVLAFNNGHYEEFYKSPIVSGCKKEEVKDKVLKFMFTESDKYGNLTSACPFKKGFYAMKGFKILPSDLPESMPSGQYRFDFHVITKHAGVDTEVYMDKYYFTYAK